jgi:hypothetical protein
MKFLAAVGGFVLVTSFVQAAEVPLIETCSDKAEYAYTQCVVAIDGSGVNDLVYGSYEW